MTKFRFKKLIASGLVVVFSWQQMGYGQDPLLPGTEVQQPTTTSFEQSSPDPGGDASQASSTTNQFLAQELSLTPASLETNDPTPLDFLSSWKRGENWKVEIRNGNLEYIESSLGRLENAVFNDAGILTSGTFTDSTGAINAISGGLLIKRTRTDGTEEFYEGGLITRTRDLQGNIQTYERKFRADGSVETLTVVYGESFLMPPPAKLQEQFSTFSTSLRIASDTNYAATLQSLKFDTKMAVTSLDFWLTRYKDAQGNVAARIYKDNNGALGTLVAKSRVRDVREFPRSDSTSRSNGTWQSFAFENTVEFEANQIYWIAVEIEPGFTTLGSSSNYLISYRNESGTYTGGQAARRKTSGTFEKLSGDLDFRLNGYAGGIPGPPKDQYTVDSTGELLDSTGRIVTAEVVGEKTGFSLRRPLPQALLSLAESFHGLKAQTYKLLSPANVPVREYEMEIGINGDSFKAPVTLQAGLNNAVAAFSDAEGNRVSFSWEVYSDTFPPKVEQVSEAVTHTSAAELAYLLNGELKKEKVYLKAGRNVLSREFSNPWGTTNTEFILDFEPVLEDGTILRYRNGVIHEVEKDGLLLQNIELAADGTLTAGSILTPNGERIEIREGKVKEIHSPSGRLREFQDNFILKDLRPENLALYFSRMLDAQGNVSHLTVQEGETAAMPPTSILYSVASSSSQTASVGDNDYKARFQGIRYSQIISIESMDFLITRYKDPQGLVLVKIYKDNAGIPGEVIAASERKDVRDFPRKDSTSYSNGQWQTFKFQNVIELAANTSYWVSLEVDSSNYPTLGNGSNYILTYRHDSNPYADGVAGRVSLSGSFSKQTGGDLNLKIKGYWGNAPKNPVSEYGVNATGELLDANHQPVQSPFVPYKEGYTLKTNSGAQTLREGAELSQVLQHAVAFKFPPELSLARLLSSPITNQKDYALRYEAGSAVSEKMVSLVEGENHLQVEIKDAIGQVSPADFWITLDTTAPEMELLSAGETQFSQYTLRYLADGYLREEVLQLKKGENQIIREAKDAAGNLSRQSFVIHYLPFFEEHEAVYDEAHHLIEVKDPVTGARVEYAQESPYEILIKNQAGGIQEVIGTAYHKKTFEGTVTLTRENGIQTIYEGQKILGFRFPDGTEVQEVELDAEGNVEKGLIFYPNGNVDVIRFGILLRTTEANGTVRDFSFSGYPAREMTKEGMNYYYFVTGGTGEFEQVKVEDAGGTFWVYDKEGTLERIDYLSGASTFFSQGLLSEIRTETGKKYLYTGANVKKLEYQLSDVPSAKIPVELSYDLQGNLTSLQLWDGSRMVLENGLVNEAFDVEGNKIAYDYFWDNGLLTGLQATRGQTEFIYERGGFLKAIATPEGTIQRQAQGANANSSLVDETAVDLLLELAGGNRLTEFELDSEGKIIRGILETKEGIKQRIENGVLTGFETLDGKIYEVKDNRASLKEWHFRNGTRVLYGGGNISEILFPDQRRLHTIGFNARREVESFTEELADGTQKVFAGNRLVKLITPEQVEIHYSQEGFASRVLFQDGSEEVISYKRNSSGEIEEIIFEGEFTYRTFKPDGALIRLLTGGVEAGISNQQITGLSTRFGNIANPQFNSQGVLTGEIQFVDGTKQTLKDGELIEAILFDQTKIRYSEGRIASIETADKVYRILYTEGPAVSQVNLQVEITTKDNTAPPVTAALVPYLLANPDSIVSKILLSRPLHDALGERSNVQSGFETGSSEQPVYFTKLTSDTDRGPVYEFGSNYLPQWDEVSLAISSRNDGFISRSVVMGAGGTSEHLPALTADFLDMNGDGLKDRVYMDTGTSPDWWWVQLNTGQDFQDAVKWEEVDRRYDDSAWETEDYNYGALRHYEGRHPHVLGDLADMNGDGRPDRILQKHDGSGTWYAQLNNGAGFDSIKTWSTNVQPVSQWSAEATYASQVRNDKDGKSVQELLADLIDLDGDGLPDRVVRPSVEPYDHWFFQKNSGTGFEDTMLWKGVDAGFYAGSEKMGASLSWYFRDSGSLISELSGLVDLNGDKRPDRVLLKNENPSDENSALDWYVQWNNGKGFDSAVLWDSDVRRLPGTATAKSGTSLKVFKDWDNPRNVLTDLRDVTGDGLPDRVTIDQNTSAAVPAGGSTAQGTWWVEVNTGTTFAQAVAWTGIEGANPEETSISQENENFRSNTVGASPAFVEKVSDLTDMNGDKIPDRVIFREGEEHWLIQFGTGSGFLPASPMKIRSLAAPTEAIRTSRYDFLHVSLKAENLVSESAGKVKVTLGDPNQPAAYQEWTLSNLGTSWQDFYLPLDGAAVPEGGGSKANASELKISFDSAPGSPAAAIYADNATFLRLRPPAARDWLDRLLTEENILSEIHSQKTQTLAEYLQFVKAGDNVPAFEWEKLLTAETRIEFDAEGEAREFETLYGAVSKIEDGRVLETRLPDGTHIEFEDESQNPFNQATQTIVKNDGSIEKIELRYGRVRKYIRSEGSPLEYTYEFCGSSASAEVCGGDTYGREITVVHDPDTGVTERYVDNQLISRIQASGIETRFEYNEKGELVRSTLSYKGRVRHTFQHSVAASGHLTVTTEEGILEEYSADGKILFHTTQEGYRYAHHFEKARRPVIQEQTETVTFADGTSLTVQIPSVTLVDDPQGEEIQRVSLVGSQAASGELAEYEREILKSLELLDGTKISFEKTAAKEITDPETGELSSVVELMDAVVFHQDGSITEFKDGKPFFVTSASGRVLSLVTEDGLLIDAQESRQFHHAQALKLWQETVLAKWNTFQAPPTLPVQMEYSVEGKLLTRQFAEGVIELYEGGKIEQVLAKDGERLVHYEYDSEGNPVRIAMEGARRRLESSVLKLRAEIAIEREEALSRIADREQVLNQTIEGEYRAIRDRLRAVRTQIETKRDDVAAIEVRGKQALSMIGDAMNQINDALNQVNGALEKLARDRNQALEKLSQQVAQASVQVETETADAYAKIETENQKARESILRQEISPVVYHWYRKILGRDPSKAEYDAVIAGANYTAGTFDLEAIKARLLSSEELSARTAEVQAIKSRVESELLRYLALPSEDRMVFTQALGILPEEHVALSQTEAEALLSWLKSRSLHFGQSAYLALEALLSEARISFTRVELATRLILTDILTGTLTPFEKDDLVISFYALKRAAAGYGLETYALKMTYDVLRQMYLEVCPEASDACRFRLIAHIDGDHYVIVTKVTESEVTYIDPSAGPEKGLDIQTITQAEFLETWIDPRHPDDGFGFVLSSRPPPVTADSFAFSLLSVSEQMQIRGAFFFFLIPLFIAIAKAIWGIVTAVITAVKFLVAGLVSGIGNILGGFGQILHGFFTGNFLAGLKAGFAGILKGFGTIGGAFKSAFMTLHGALLTGIQGIAKSIPLFGGVLSKMTATSAFSGFLKFGLVGLTLDGTARLLDAIGISPKFAQTLLSGGKIIAGVALLATGNPMGLSFVAGGTSELLNLHTTLSPTLSGIIGLSAAALGAFAGGGINTGSLAGSLAGLKEVLPHLTMDFVSAGVVGIGDLLGLDPRFASLIQLPLRAAAGNLIGRFMGSVTGYRDDGTPITVSNPYDSGIVLTSVKDLFVDSQNPQYRSSSIGFDFSGSSNSLLDSLSAGGVMRSIELSLGKSGLFNGILDILGQAALSPFHLGESILKASLDSFTNFSELIQDKGLGGAFEALATSIFKRETLEKIFNLGGVSSLFGSTGKILTTLVTGETAEELKVSDTASLFFDLAGQFIGKKEAGITQIGTFGSTASGKWGLLAGNVIAYLLGDLVFAGEIQNGQLMGGTLSGPNGMLAAFNPEGGPGPIIIRGPDPENPEIGGSFWNLVLKIIPFAFDFFFVLKIIPFAFDFFFKGDTLQKIETEINHDSETETLPGEEQNNNPLYVLTNGIASGEPNETPPSYISNLKSDLIEQGQGEILDKHIIPTHIFLRNFNEIGDAVKDIIHWIAESQAPFIPLDLVYTIIKNINKHLSRYPEIARTSPMIGMGYSGGFFPLIEALTLGGYNVSSVVGLGAATVSLAGITGDVLEIIIEAAGKIENGVVDGLGMLLRKIPFVGDIVDSILNFVQNGLVENAFDLLKTAILKLVEPLQRISSNADFIVNVWGTNDILTKLGIAGYHDDILGLSANSGQIFNIEIIGASHFDYLRKDDASPKNLATSEFITNLIRRSTTEIELLNFLRGDDRVRFDPLTNTYGVNLGLAGL